MWVLQLRTPCCPPVEPPTGGTERLLNLKLFTRTGVVNLVCAYAPTLCSTVDEKDQFYDALDSTIRSVPSKEALFIMRDFNARVGADWEAWPSIIGDHGIGKMNENGQRLLELCSFRNLAITSTFFEHKDQHKVSWRHPRSKHWHQLDMILCKKRDLNSVKTPAACTAPTATRTTSSSAPRSTSPHARCTTPRPRASLASMPVEPSASL